MPLTNYAFSGNSRCDAKPYRFTLRVISDMNKFLKLLIACLICAGVITGLVLLIQQLI